MYQCQSQVSGNFSFVLIFRSELLSLFSIHVTEYSSYGALRPFLCSHFVYCEYLDYMSKTWTRRAGKSFDYKIFGSTGQKVFIDRRNLIKMEQIVDSELKISKKLKRFFNEYELSLLFDVKDVELGIAELKELTNEYDDIHSKLSRTSKDAGDDVYEETYQAQYDEMTSEIGKWIRQARSEIKAKKENQ